MSWYVYELVDPRCDEVFYVGKGKSNRVDDHEKEAAAGRVSRKCDRIRAITEAGATIGKRVVQRFADEQAAYDFEANLIGRYGLANLTNVVSGGGGILSSDRIFVLGASEFANRTKCGTIRWLFVDGKPIDMLAIVEAHKERISKIAQRRGLDWVNRQSLQNKVRYDYG